MPAEPMQAGLGMVVWMPTPSCGASSPLFISSLSAFQISRNFLEVKIILGVSCVSLSVSTGWLLCVSFVWLQSQ